MPSNTAAIWAAVAASFSAFSSFLIMLTQRRNLLESVRPELVLTGWSRTTEGQADAAHEVIGFETIKNVGRGAALHVYLLGGSQVVANRPTAFLATTRLPILSVNQEVVLHGRVFVSWKNVEADAQGHKHLSIPITIWCWDSRGIRHETRYNLFAVELSGNVGVVVDVIAPGVMLMGRTTTSGSEWRLRWSSRLGRR
jgi:hypothetical protein